MSLIISVVAVVAAYPIAYYIALIASKRKYVLLLLILAPFLVSYFLRLLAWKVILGDQGVINSFLWTGIRDEPVTWLLYSQFAVILTLIYVYIPFVALPIFASLEALDRRLLEAASDWGRAAGRPFASDAAPLPARRDRGLHLRLHPDDRRVLHAPPRRRRRRDHVRNAIADQFGQSLNWLNGSVLSFFLLVVVAVLMGVFARFLTVRRVATG